jgi:hypothetical protein
MSLRCGAAVGAIRVIWRALAAAPRVASPACASVGASDAAKMKATAVAIAMRVSCMMSSC